MFDTRLTTPLVSGVGASSMFKNITAASDMPDETFLSSLRALLQNRIGNKRLTFLYKQTNADNVWNNEDLKPDADTILLVFFRLAGRAEVGEKLIADLDNGERVWPGFTEVEKAARFFKSHDNPVRLFTNAETRSTVLFVLSRFSLWAYHDVQTAIPVCFPWYFDVKQGVTPLEHKLLESLTKTDSDAYMACMAEYEELFKLREEGIRALVGDIEHRYERVELENTKGKLQDIASQLADYNRMIRDLLQRKRDLDIHMVGLISRTKDEIKESPLVGYFKSNRHAEVVASDNDSITVLVRNVVSIYDEFEAERTISNKRSLLYRNDGELDDGDMELLMRAIFIDKTLQISFCAAYRLYLCGSVDGLRGYNFGSKYDDCMPNPHIEHYGCIGDYQQIIEEALQEGDLIGAVESSAASCVSLNFGDGAVMEEFVNDIQGNGRVNNRCIVLPDGSVVKPAQAVAYLRREM